MSMESLRAYEIHFLKDENGNESWHLAKDKGEAVNAHLTHWGVESIEANAQHLSMIRKKAFCKSTKCLAAVGLKKSQVADIEEMLLP